MDAIGVGIFLLPEHLHGVLHPNICPNEEYPVTLWGACCSQSTRISDACAGVRAIGSAGDCAEIVREQAVTHLARHCRHCSQQPVHTTSSTIKPPPCTWNAAANVERAVSQASPHRQRPADNHGRGRCGAVRSGFRSLQQIDRPGVGGQPQARESVSPGAGAAARVGRCRIRFRRASSRHGRSRSPQNLSAAWSASGTA